MAFEFNTGEDGIVYMTLSGRISRDDLVRIVRQMAELESQSEKSPHRLTDLTGVEGLDFEAGAIMDIAFVRRKAPLKNKVSSAIVAPTSLLYGYARIFQTLNDNPAVTLQIFPDKKSALAWLKKAARSG